MTKQKIIIGTRGSALALAQAHETQRVLHENLPGHVIGVEIISTTGDQRLDLDLSAPVDASGARLPKGLFTKELEVALIERRIDVAVHSLKDLPTTLPDGLKLMAVLERESTRDLLITCEPLSLMQLPLEAVVASGSVRRRLQLLGARPDLTLVGLRGNVPTRLAKLATEREWSAIVLAEAGLHRLGILPKDELAFRHEGHSFYADPAEDIFLAAPGQGAIGLECRSDDAELAALLAPVNHQATWDCVTVERALLRGLGGACQTPLGVGTRWSDGLVHLTAQLDTEGAASKFIAADIALDAIDVGIQKILTHFHS